MNYKKLITSSANAKEVSLTVKGILTGLVPLVIYLTGLSPDDVNTLMDSIITIIEMSFSLVSTIFVVVGLVRKVYHKRWSASE